MVANVGLLGDYDDHRPDLIQSKHKKSRSQDMRDGAFA
jgi:hypothetical protein